MEIEYIFGIAFGILIGRLMYDLFYSVLKRMGGWR